jgi:diguanylate cyclase (GGDEF)-like protein/PAS domain S-box-containing protein
MNVLSLLSSLVAYSFVFSGVYILRLNRKEALNITAALVNFCFAIWAFCSVFFYPAPSLESAWLWHRLGAVGWILFAPFAAHFFLLLSGLWKKGKDWAWYPALYGLPAALLAATLFSDYSPAAKGFVQSRSGLGWTYISSAGSFLYGAYLAYVVLYFGLGLFVVYRWGKASGRRRLMRQARGLVFLDCGVIALNICTDLVAPAIGPHFPPLGNLLVSVWMLGFLILVRRFKIMTVYDVADSELILATVMDPVLLLDRGGIILKCNGATSKLLKYPMEKLLQRRLSDFYRSGRYKRENLTALTRDKHLDRVELELLDAEGGIIHAMASFSLAESEEDGVVGLVANLHDISHLKIVEKELFQRQEKYRLLAEELDLLANCDKLTGLPNRRKYFHALGEALDRHRGEGLAFSLVFIDLDGFKAVNDLFGHDTGDSVLVAVAERLRSALREGDLAARVGGDEFILLFINPASHAGLDGVMEALLRRFEEPIAVKGAACAIGLSFGVSRCPEDGMSSDELMKAADERMYLYKKSQRIDATRKEHFHSSPPSLETGGTAEPRKP